MWEGASTGCITTKHFPEWHVTFLHPLPLQLLNSLHWGSHSLIALLRGNLVFLPPDGNVPPLFTYYKRVERFLRNLRVAGEGSGSFVPVGIQISTCLHAESKKNLESEHKRSGSGCLFLFFCFLSPLVSMGICVWVATLNPFTAPQGLGLSPETGCEEQQELKWVERKDLFGKFR